MAWGGGWGGGGAMFGGRGTAEGLPFGGIPSELMQEASKLLASEPHHEPSQLTFTQLPTAKERQRLTLPRLVSAYPGYLTAGSALVVVISLVLQAGPLLTEFAINNGMRSGHHSASHTAAVCAR